MTSTQLDDRFPRLFWRLDDAAHAAFARYGKVHRVPKAAVLIREGEPSISFFLVLDGEVALSAGGKELGRVGRNHSFGEMGMLLDLPRAGTASATTESRVLEVSRADIQAMQDKEPLWALRLYRVMAECLADYLRVASAARRAAER